MCTHLSRFRSKLLLKTFTTLIRYFKKKRKKLYFLKSEKKRKIGLRILEH